MELILMYRAESLRDMRNTYPAKINPAVPNTFRATLIAPIYLRLLQHFFGCRWGPSCWPKRRRSFRRRLDVTMARLIRGSTTGTGSLAGGCSAPLSTTNGLRPDGLEWNYISY